MTTPNQKNQQQGNRFDRGTGQTQDDRQRTPQQQQQGGRAQPDMPASTPRTDRDVQQQDYDRNRTDLGDRTDVETDKGQQNR